MHRWPSHKGWSSEWRSLSHSAVRCLRPGLWPPGCTWQSLLGAECGTALTKHSRIDDNYPPWNLNQSTLPSNINHGYRPEIIYRNSTGALLCWPTVWTTSATTRKGVEQRPMQRPMNANDQHWQICSTDHEQEINDYVGQRLTISNNHYAYSEWWVCCG